MKTLLTFCGVYHGWLVGFVALRPKSTAMVIAGTVSSPNHTFFLGRLEQAVNQYISNNDHPVKTLLTFCGVYHGWLVGWFCCFTSQVNSYGHCGTVSSPNHTFFLGRLEQAVNQYFVHILSLVTDNNPS